MRSGGRGIFSWGDRMCEVKSRMVVRVWVLSGIEGGVVL